MMNVSNRLRLGKFKRTLEKINARKDAVAAMSDEELCSQTEILRSRFKAGASDRDILPDAFAVMRENMKRKIGIFLFDVQVIGALALYEGMIAEMKTGEGKTFTAVLPIYLQFLTGRRTILVTTNSYLAGRDLELLREVYESMGMSAALGIFSETKRRIKPEEKQAVYASDVVYTTCGDLGFDYLMENLTFRGKDRYLKPFDCVIIDEVDAVLLDSAQMPLIISGAPRVQSNLYGSTDFFVRTLKRDTDYEMEDESCWLTEAGTRKAEKFFSIDNIYDGKHYDFIRHIMLALRAHLITENEKNYVISDRKVKLLDGNTGRILENTKMQGGQHQAVEAKENVPITPVTRAMASITYQDLFNMFPKLAGMSGTVMSDSAEFKEIYGVDTVSIPTNEKMIRRDLPARAYSSIEEELEAAVDWILARHETGQPVLVITASIGLSEIVSELLLEAEIPHNLLNAHTAAKEAEMIAEAGRVGAITVATSMAGRGTDIRLSDEAIRLGGLAVAGVGEMGSLRLELQARGRAGRQGEPGVSCFFVSLEDEVVKPTLKKKQEKMIGMKGELKRRSVRRTIRLAQKASDRHGRSSRKTTMIFGESVRQQRDLVYRMRREIQGQKAGGGGSERGISDPEAESRRPYRDRGYFIEQEKAVIGKFLASNSGQLDSMTVTRFVLDNITYRLDHFPEDHEVDSVEKARLYLENLAEEKLTEKLEQLKDEKVRGQYLEIMMLKAIDESWIEEVDYLQQLRAAITGRKYTQRDMAFEYHEEAYKAYGRMREKIRSKMLKNILLGEIQWTKERELQVVLP